MTGLDAFALLVLAVLLCTTVGAALVLAALPGRIARERQHLQAEAISVCGWLGLVTGVVWIVAIVWAYTVPGGNAVAPEGAAKAADS